MKINKPLFKSQKGDAIILLSVLITGIVLLITVLSVENLRKSAEIQNLQQQSLSALYKAEEGIEFSLYANKEKLFGSPGNSDFSVSVWDGKNRTVTSNDFSSNSDLTATLAQSAQNRTMVVSSENKLDSTTGNLKRTVFGNLPSRYYDQLNLWDFTNGCSQNACSISNDNNDMAKGNSYQVAVSTSDFQKSDWTSDNTFFRIVFRCGGSSCTIKNLKVGLDCNVTQCPFSVCPTTMNINMWNEQTDMTGRVILSNWFKYLDTNGNPLDLRNRKLIISFDLTEGTLSEVSGLPGDDIKMCRQTNSGGWQAFTDRMGGAVGLEMKKMDESIQYHCCGYQQVCAQYNQVCAQYQQVCAQYQQVCAQYQQVCQDNSNGYYCSVCRQYPSTCYALQTAGYIYYTNGNCLQWTNGSCLQWTNGDCIKYTNGTCAQWSNGECNRWCKNQSN